MSNESGGTRRFEDRLLDAILQQHDAVVSGAQASDTGPRRHRVRPLVAGGMAAVLAAGAVAGFELSAGTQLASTGVLDAKTLAYDTSNALDQANTCHIDATTTVLRNSSGDITSIVRSWNLGPARQRVEILSPDGRLLSDASTELTGGGLHQRVVDYSTHQYSDITIRPTAQRLVSPAKGKTGGPMAVSPPRVHLWAVVAMSIPPQFMAAMIRAQQAAGFFNSVTATTLDGRPVVQLAHTRPTTGSSGTSDSNGSSGSSGSTGSSGTASSSSGSAAGAAKAQLVPKHGARRALLIARARAMAKRVGFLQTARGKALLVHGAVINAAPVCSWTSAGGSGSSESSGSSGTGATGTSGATGTTGTTGTGQSGITGPSGSGVFGSSGSSGATGSTASSGSSGGSGAPTAKIQVTGPLAHVGIGQAAFAPGVYGPPCSDHWTVWVDPSTYLPVQSESVLPDGGTAESSFAWSSPTAANLAQLTAKVPAGFTQASHPLSQPEPAIGTASATGVCW